MDVLWSEQRRMRRPGRAFGVLLTCIALAALPACTAAEKDVDAAAATNTAASAVAGTSHDTAGTVADNTNTPAADSMQVEVWFARGEEVVPVVRWVPATDDTLTAALHELLAGPTAAEGQQGLTSWFSAQTADALRSARVEDGLAIVDLRDISGIISNASTSLGSTLLLGALNGTVFSASSADSAEYQFDGSCDAFGEFVQRGCLRYARQP